MSELKTYDMEFDREETCPFCGRVYTGSDEEDYMNGGQRRSACTCAAWNVQTGQRVIRSAPSAPRRKVSVMVNRPDPCGQKARRLVGLVPTSQSVNNNLRPPNNRHVVPINQDGCVRLDLGHGVSPGRAAGKSYQLPGTADAARRTRTAPVP